MRTCGKAILVGVLSALIWSPARAEQLLEPEPGVLAEPKAYHLKIAGILGSKAEGETLLSVYILASFEVEELVGIRRTEKGFEVYRLAASSSIWAAFSKSGYASPTKKQSKGPSPYAKIKVLQTIKAIPQEMADRIKNLWEKHLLEARYPPPKTWIGLDGESYHFQMFILGRGIVSAQTWSPLEFPAKEMAELAEALSVFARGKIDLAALELAVGAAEKTIGS